MHHVSITIEHDVGIVSVFNREQVTDDRLAGEGHKEVVSRVDESFGPGSALFVDVVFLQVESLLADFVSRNAIFQVFDHAS